MRILSNDGDRISVSKGEFDFKFRGGETMNIIVDLLGEDLLLTVTKQGGFLIETYTTDQLSDLSEDFFVQKLIAEFLFREEFLAIVVDLHGRSEIAMDWDLFFTDNQRSIEFYPFMIGSKKNWLKELSTIDNPQIEFFENESLELSLIINWNEGWYEDISFIENMYTFTHPDFFLEKRSN